MKSGLIGLFVLAMWGSNAAATAGVAIRTRRPPFRASMKRVTVAATVRTRRGRPVVDLKASDFQLLDSGTPRTIADFTSDPTPVSLALLVDFSGSMGVGERRRRRARHRVAHRELAAAGHRPGRPLRVRPGAARAAADRAGAGRHPRAARVGGAAVRRDVALRCDRRDRPPAAGTGGRAARSLRSPTAPTTPAGSPPREVSASPAASTCPSTSSSSSLRSIARARRRRRRAAGGRAARRPAREPGALDRRRNLRRHGPAQSSKAARQIVTELRQQYLIAFEPDGRRDGTRSSCARGTRITSCEREAGTSSGRPSARSVSLLRRYQR